MSSLERRSFPNTILARETIMMLLAAHAELRATAQPQRTLGGYGIMTVDAFGRQIVTDARLSAAEEFVTMARVQVRNGEDEFHEIDARVADGALMAKVHDRDGHIVTDWQTMISLAMLMRYVRIRPKPLYSPSQGDIIASR